MAHSTYIIRSESAPRFQLPGIEFTGFVTPSRGSSEISTWLITVAAGLDSPAAHTLDRDEVFTMLAGTLRLHPDSLALRAGDAAVVPAGTPIQLSNPGTDPARALVSVTSGFSAAAGDGTPIDTPPWAL